MDQPPVEGPARRRMPGASPDVVGAEVSRLPPRLKGHTYVLTLTSPPKPRGEKGALRVVAQRKEGDTLRLICAREYYDVRRPVAAEAAEASEQAEGRDAGEKPQDE